MSAGAAARMRRLGRTFAARAARRYVAGAEIGDALRVADGLRERGFVVVVGFFDGGEPPATVEAVDAGAIEALAGRPDVQLAVKPPALGDGPARLRRLALAAAEVGIGLHCDSLRVGQAEAGLAVPLELAAAGGPAVGVTLPGRWPRSLQDADRVAALDLPVRVIKGQWADPADPRRDPDLGFRALIDRLAGRRAPVAVASHDGALAADTLRRLLAAGTPCELQLLYGLPSAAPLAAAQQLGVPVRAYVPFGTAYLPYALSALVRRPGLARWLAHDLVARRAWADGLSRTAPRAPVPAG